MKKITILFVVLLLCSTIVLASYTDVVNTEKDKYKVTYQTIEKGWNLLPADMINWHFKIPESEINQKVKANYLYLPVDNKYINLLDGLNSQELQEMEVNRPYLKSTSAWFYISEPMTLSYEYEFTGWFSLDQGWNLLTMSPSMSELNPDVYSSKKFPIGDCEAQKVYTWSSEIQNWEPVSIDQLGWLSSKDLVGVGIAIKVKNSCELGVVPSESSVAPPALPN